MRRPTLVFDGDCAFCSRCAGVARRILPADHDVTAWQQLDLTTVGITAERAQAEVLWIADGGEVVGGAPAVAHALRAAGGVWAWLGLLLVAANRYRLPGGTSACRVPSSPPAPDVEAA